MDFSAYPKIANFEYSPESTMLSYPDGQYDQSYPGENYTSPSDYTMNSYLDSESFFDQPFNSVETHQSYPSKSQDPYSSTVPSTSVAASNANPAFRQTFDPSASYAPFEQTFPQNFSLNPSTLESPQQDPVTFSPNTHVSSRTPSLCGDTMSLHQATFSPSLSPRALKRESPLSPPFLPAEESTTPKRPLRKRGRPRLSSPTTTPASSTSSSTPTTTPTTSSGVTKPRTGRLPHNQVERKYREGLNTELERLRCAVPSLRQSPCTGAANEMLVGAPKPSKAMVLSSAIDYIKKVETERDALLAEVERLKAREREREVQQGNARSRVWGPGDVEGLEEFLMES